MTQELIEAVRQGNVAQVQALVSSSKLDITYAGNPILFIAAFNGYQEIVKLLLAAGATIDFTGESQLTALHAAILGRQQNIVALLLQAGAEVNFVGQDSVAPIHFAVQKAHLPILELLLQAGAKVDLATTQGITPLHMAVQIGNLRIVNLLLSFKAKVNAVNHDQATPLHVAALQGDLAITQALLEAGADVNLGAIDGTTPLYMALQAKHIKVAESLLAKFDVTKSEAVIVLYLAAQMGFLTIVTKLLQAGVPPDTVDINGSTPLLIAIQNGHEQVIATLLQFRAQVTLADKFGATPLHLAVQAGNQRLVQVLLDKGAEINAVTITKLTPLYVAIQNDHAEIIRLLLLAGATPNCATTEGMTPLYLAVQKGSLGIVKLLLQFGADVTIPVNGETPLQLALRKQQRSIIKILKPLVTARLNLQRELQGLLEQMKTVLQDIKIEILSPVEQDKVQQFTSYLDSLDIALLNDAELSQAIKAIQSKQKYFIELRDKMHESKSFKLYMQLQTLYGDITQVLATLQDVPALETPQKAVFDSLFTAIQGKVQSLQGHLSTAALMGKLGLWETPEAPSSTPPAPRP